MQPKEHQEVLSNIAVKLRHYAKNPENAAYLPESMKRLSTPEFIERKPRSSTEWHLLMEERIAADESLLRLHEVMKIRRSKERSINGPFELALLPVENEGQARVRDKMIEALRGIEMIELSSVAVEEAQHLSTRSRRQLKAEMRLKMNKLVQEYQKLEKMFLQLGKSQ